MISKDAKALMQVFRVDLVGTWCDFIVNKRTESTVWCEFI
jgi:hypothetical protein